MKRKRSRWTACRLAKAHRQVPLRILTASLILAGVLHAPPLMSQVSGGIPPRSVKPQASSSKEGHPFNNAAGSNERISVEGRVDLEIPKGWLVHNENQRHRVREVAQEITQVAGQYIAAFSASSNPQPSKIWIRVSFIPLDSPIQQATLRHLVTRARSELINGVSESWYVESKAMWQGLSKQGIKEVGKPTFDVEDIDGKIAFTIRYGRTSADRSSDTVRVTQYHVPLGTDKALITLSHIDDKDSFQKTSLIRQSIRIR